MMRRTGIRIRMKNLESCFLEWPGGRMPRCGDACSHVTFDRRKTGAGVPILTTGTRGADIMRTL